MALWGWAAAVVGALAVIGLVVAMAIAMVNVRQLNKNLPNQPRKSLFETVFDGVADFVSFVFLGGWRSGV